MPGTRYDSPYTAGMGRPKTISDDEVLRVAREVFRGRGHSATTREVAQAAGISEAVLYQRFGSKDDLFFAAMRPTEPDVDRLLGPVDPPDDARSFLQTVTVRIGDYFAGVIPLGLRVMTHPSFDPASVGRAIPRAHAVIHKGLLLRLASLARRRRLASRSVPATARLLVSLAHDWALAGVQSHTPPARRSRELKELVDVVWHGVRARSR